jgi:hypothetical protein
MIVVLRAKSIECALLIGEGRLRRRSGLFLEGLVHPLVSTVLLGMSRLSVAAKMEGVGIEKMEGPGNQKGRLGSSGWLRTSSTALR